MIIACVNLISHLYVLLSDYVICLPTFELLDSPSLFGFAVCVGPVSHMCWCDYQQTFKYRSFFACYDYEIYHGLTII